MEIEKIKKADTKYIGKKIEFFKEIDSTHKYAKQHIDSIETGTIIISETQTQGMGTKGRTWYTGNNKNIAMTIVLRPNAKVIELNNLTINLAEAIQQAILKLYDIELKIKEPNDLFLNGKKVCGILTEVHSRGEEINYLLISIGFNVNEIEFPKEFEKIATSLKKEYYHINFSIENIITEIVRKIEKIV